MKPRTEHERRQYVRRLVIEGYDPGFAQWVSRSAYSPEHPVAREAYILWCAYHPAAVAS